MVWITYPGMKFLILLIFLYLKDFISISTLISTVLVELLKDRDHGFFLFSFPPSPTYYSSLLYSFCKFLLSACCIPGTCSRAMRSVLIYVLKDHSAALWEWPEAGSRGKRVSSWRLFLGGSSGKESTCQCRRHRRRGFDPWVGKTPWRRKCNMLQYSCLENSMGRGTWQATVHQIPKSQTWLSKHTNMCTQHSYPSSERKGHAKNGDRFR